MKNSVILPSELRRAMARAELRRRGVSIAPEVCLWRDEAWLNAMADKLEEIQAMNLPNTMTERDLTDELRLLRAGGGS